LAGGGWQDSHASTAAARLYLRAAGSKEEEEKQRIKEGVSEFGFHGMNAFKGLCADF
jgi:hypothetical protein